MNAPDSPTDPRDLQIAAMTVAGRSAAEITSEIGCSPSTVHRTRRTWRAWIDHSRQEMAERVAGDLLSLCANAASALADLLRSRNESIKLGAIRTTLDAASKWREAADLERRIASLEAERWPGNGNAF